MSDEAVNLIEARNSYNANLDSLKVADEMQKSTFSLIA
jgi:flagellar basal body rod protein FlgC